MLRFDHVSFWYDRREPPVAYDFSFTLGVQEFVAIVGVSGAGKSTLLRLGCGLLQSQTRSFRESGTLMRGDVLYEGKAVNEPHSRFAYVPQNFSAALLPARCARDNILLAAEFDGISDTEIRAAELLMSRSGIVDVAQIRAHRLSGGQQQRVAICRSLINRPRVLFMDEPFASLDPTLKPEISELLQGFREPYDLSLLMVTHDILGAVRLADRLIGIGQKGGRPVYTEWTGANLDADKILTWMQR